MVRQNPLGLGWPWPAAGHVRWPWAGGAASPHHDAHGHFLQPGQELPPPAPAFLCVHTFLLLLLFAGRKSKFPAEEAAAGSPEPGWRMMRGRVDAWPSLPPFPKAPCLQGGQPTPDTGRLFPAGGRSPSNHLATLFGAKQRASGFSIAARCGASCPESSGQIKIHFFFSCRGSPGLEETRSSSDTPPVVAFLGLPRLVALCRGRSPRAPARGLCCGQRSEGSTRAPVGEMGDV